MTETSHPVVLRRAEDMAQWALNQHRQGLRIGFVPTMGALHDGHLSLVTLARDKADVVVVSIFVNPRQFGEGEDFEAYPRDPEADIDALRHTGVDAVFLPEVTDIYPQGEHTPSRTAGAAALILEGESRPEHFDGVVTVVSRLFELVRPDVAVFGKKDAQQLVVLKEYATQHHPSVEMVAGEVFRDPDGLALSSRNRYLTPVQRETALRFPEVLARAAEQLQTETGRVEKVLSDARNELHDTAGLEVDYIELVDAVNFSLLEKFQPGRCVLVGAVRVGHTRLIDAVWWDSATGSFSDATWDPDTESETAHGPQ